MSEVTQTRKQVQRRKSRTPGLIHVSEILGDLLLLPEFARLREQMERDEREAA